jgi:single-stranded DNA-binding protein
VASGYIPDTLACEQPFSHIPLTLHEVTELRLSVPETGRRLLPLPVAAWHATVGRAAIEPIAKGDAVLVHGHLVRRFYRSGAGARSLTEVVATGLRRLDPQGERADGPSEPEPVIAPA